MPLGPEEAAGGRRFIRARPRASRGARRAILCLSDGLSPRAAAQKTRVAAREAAVLAATPSARRLAQLGRRSTFERRLDALLPQEDDRPCGTPRSPRDRHGAAAGPARDQADDDLSPRVRRLPANGHAGRHAARRLHPAQGWPLGGGGAGRGARGPSRKAPAAPLCAGERRVAYGRGRPLRQHAGSGCLSRARASHLHGQRSRTLLRPMGCRSQGRSVDPRRRAPGEARFCGNVG